MTYQLNSHRCNMIGQWLITSQPLNRANATLPRQVGHQCAQSVPIDSAGGDDSDA